MLFNLEMHCCRLGLVQIGKKFHIVNTMYWASTEFVYGPTVEYEFRLWKNEQFQIETLRRQEVLNL